MSDAKATPHLKASLPAVVLGVHKIPLNVLRFIPLESVEKYQICAFEITDDVVKLALVHSEQLKQGFDVAIRDIAAKTGKNVVLYRTDSASLRKVIKQYREELRLADEPVQSGTKPPLFELGKTVVYNFLRRIPLTYASKHRLICVDFLAPNTYWVVTDGTNADELRHLVPMIEKHNNITAHLITISRREFEDLREYYESQEKLVPKQNAVAKDEPKIAPGVVVTDSQAVIVSSEVEKNGLAGLIQRVGQNIPAAGKLAEGADVPVALSVLPPLPKKEVIKEVRQIVSTPVVSAVVESDVKTSSEPDDENIGKLLTKQVESIEELTDIVRKGFVPRIVAAILSFGIFQKASDVHIEAFEDEVRVRFRVDGQLSDVIRITPEVHAAMVSRIKILAHMRLDENRIPQDGRFDVQLNGSQIDLRVSIMPTVHGEKVVMRILDKSKGIASLENVGLVGRGFERLIHAITRPYGICLMTGPTGSGKSTSLYAILKRVSQSNVNIVTLEDPVEYELKGINQSQIRPKIGFTFAEGLRSVLRQDPNIIMVGEIRDGETATMATQAALTGHLVLSTLHTNDAAGAIPRLNNMGIEPFLIASSLDIIVGQRLVRRLCKNCKEEIDLPPSVREGIVADLEKIKECNPVDAKRVIEPYVFFQGTGCPKCHGTGYLGRVGIYEVMEVTEAIQDLTLKRAAAADIQKQAQNEGMITMYQDGLLKAIAGLTSLNEILRESSNT